jgi:hypothetical protein
MSRRPYAILRRGLWLAAFAGLVSTGMAGAQPAPVPPPAPAAPAAAPGPAAPAAEEAPPISVPTPQPIPAPPISEKEVAPAPAPKAQVEEKVLTAPVRRARFDVAVMQTIDKVTAESVRFEAAVGRPVRYKSLVFTVKACERAAPDEAIDDSIAYLTVDSQPRPLPGKPTPAGSPGLQGLDVRRHPRA